MCFLEASFQRRCLKTLIIQIEWIYSLIALLCCFCELCSLCFSRDDQTRKIQENINNVEKHFGEMCQMFAGYVRKTARLRDKADLLVKEIGVYADLETPNLKRGMKEFADHLAKVEDYRQAEVKRYFQTTRSGWIQTHHHRPGFCLTGGATWSQSFRAVKKLWSHCKTETGEWT